MTKTATRLTVTVLLFLAVLLALGPSIGAQSAGRSFAWFAELVSFDQDAKIVTVRAPLLESVGKYISRFEPGERIVVTWTQYEGEADAVMYVATPEVMNAVRSGFIVPAELVESDTTGGTLTFRTPVPDGVARTLASAEPGTWIKVIAPRRQPDPVATLTSVVLNERPKPRPDPPEPEPELVANTDAPPVNVAGTWAVDASRRGSTITFECTVVQDGVALTGNCVSAVNTSTPLTGQVAGNTVQFRHSFETSGNPPSEYAYGGVVDDTGQKMQGTLSADGRDSSFTATKQQ